MKIVIYIAIGIGTSTLLGTLLGFLAHGIPEHWNQRVTAFSAGIMLAAALVGLLTPAVETAGRARLWMIPTGLFSGSVLLRLSAQLSRRWVQKKTATALSMEASSGDTTIRRPADTALLFVLALALHKIPEGMAAGVGFGGVDIGSALTVAAGVAIQNVPEGAVLIPPLFALGFRRRQAAYIAVAVGVVNALGVFVGYFAASFSQAILPLILAFAGGAMLDVIVSNMIPSVISEENSKMERLLLFIGFALMLVLEGLLA